MLASSAMRQPVCGAGVLGRPRFARARVYASRFRIMACPPDRLLSTPDAGRRSVPREAARLYGRCGSGAKGTPLTVSTGRMIRLRRYSDCIDVACGPPRGAEIAPIRKVVLD